MHPDELNKPLGLDVDASAGPRREIPWAAIAMGGLVVLGAGILTFARITEAPPPDRSASFVSQAPIQRPAPPPSPAPTTAPIETRTDVSHDDVTSSIAAVPPRASAGQVEDASGVRVVRQGGGEAPGALIISIPQAGVGLAPAPDARLIEDGRFGPLPRIGANGLKPMNVYARPVVTSSTLGAGAARVAIMIGGMGLNAETTNLAIARLPSAVTLGFAPYGRALPELAAKAREKGHEVILQAPMQGFGGEAEEPGPHVLRTGAADGEILTRLHWHMSRFPGYVGVSGFMGERFTADADAFGVVIRDVSRRGLFYFEDGASPRSLAVSLAASTGAPIARADLTLDAKASEIDAALANLEKLARERGVAVGYATGLPAVIDKVGRFARRLEARGVALVPVSSLARVPDQPTARAAH